VRRRPTHVRLLIVISADRGLCGSFNSNIIKAAGQFIVKEGQGHRWRSADRTQGARLLSSPRFRCPLRGRGIFQRLSFDDAAALADAAIEEFTSGRASSVLSRLQRIQIGDVAAHRRRAPAADPRLEGEEAAGPTTEYLYEPSPAEIFKDLLPRHVQVQVYRALLESNAAFFAAQMTAMDAATRNSADMLDNLTLYMNKVRQAAITREIIEVVSGAAAT
jgi:F-type H+-transporting ATPase subunit gamma